MLASTSRVDGGDPDPEDRYRYVRKINNGIGRPGRTWRRPVGRRRERSTPPARIKSWWPISSLNRGS